METYSDHVGIQEALYVSCQIIPLWEFEGFRLLVCNILFFVAQLTNVDVSSSVSLY